MSWQRALAMIMASMFLIASQAHGEQSVHRVGLLVSIQIPERIRAWKEELGRCGYVIGRDLLIEHRSFKAQTEQIPSLLSELVAFGSEVIVTSTRRGRCSDVFSVECFIPGVEDFSRRPVLFVGHKITPVVAKGGSCGMLSCVVPIRFRKT
jgi:hypothetical protein